MDTETTDNPRMFRALHLLEKAHPPRLYGYEPLWRAPMTPGNRGALIPSWNWRGVHADDIPEGENPITMDINGAFLAATGAVQVSHSQLKNMGPVAADKFAPRFETNVWPGYYRIVVPNWAFGGTICSPLGTGPYAKTGTEVWVSHPTLVLLLELLHDEVIGELVITDAWVSSRRCDFREWNARLKTVRNRLLDARDMAEDAEQLAAAKLRYKMFKEGYGAAFSMMLTGERCGVRRPDWAHAVYAQHAAAAWRKAWRLSAIGPILSMGSVDEITILRSDLAKAVAKPKPPVRLDPSGRHLGHMKEKEHEEETARVTGSTDELVYEDDFEDVL